MTRASGDGIVAAMAPRLVVALLSRGCALVLAPARAGAAGRERIAIAVFNVTGEPIAATIPSPIARVNLPRRRRRAQRNSASVSTVSTQP